MQVFQVGLLVVTGVVGHAGAGADAGGLVHPGVAAELGRWHPAGWPACVLGSQSSSPVVEPVETCSEGCRLPTGDPDPPPGRVLGLRQRPGAGRRDRGGRRRPRRQATWRRPSARLRRRRQYDAIVAALVDDAEPEVTVLGASATDEDETEAVGTLRWTWPVGKGEWSYETEVVLRRTETAGPGRPRGPTGGVAGGLGPGGGRALPDDAEVLDATDSRQRGAGSWVRGGRPWSSARPVVRLRHRPGQVPRPRPVARRAGWPQLRRHRRGAVRQAGRGRRGQGVRRGDRLPPARTSRPASARGYDQIPGALAVPDELPLAPTREFAGADPRHRRRGDRRDDRGGPRALPGRRPGRAVRAAGEVRRAARRHARRRGRRGARPTARSASCSGEEPVPGEPLRAHARRRGSSRPPSGCSPASGRPARWWRSGPRPATIVAAANGPGTDGYNMATFGQFAPGLDVQERQLAGAAARRADARLARCRAPTRSWSTASRSRTTTTTRPAGWAGSRCGPRSPTPATPPSSPGATGSGAATLADAAASLGLGRRPRPRLPGVLRPGAAAGSRRPRRPPT